MSLWIPLRKLPLFSCAGIHAEEFLFLLGQLAEASKVMRGMGRGSLKASAQEAGVVLSDNEIRTALHCLSQLGLVKIGRGRRATRISPLVFRYTGNSVQVVSHPLSFKKHLGISKPLPNPF